MSHLNSCFELLQKKIGLKPLEDNVTDEIITLKIDEFSYHFKEHPMDSIVIYSLFDDLTDISNEKLLNILNENHFSDNELSAVFSYDKQVGCFLNWNRQQIQQVTQESILSQLEVMIQANETIQELLKQDSSINQWSASLIPRSELRC